jgi:hypothetical protein
MKIAKIALLTISLLASSGPAVGQDRKPLAPSEKNQYIISAKAGVINFTEGDVTYKRGNETKMLLVGDELVSGDVVKTGANGHAEILLSPGSYLRLSPGAEFAFADTSLDRLKLQLTKGSAIVEVAVVDGLKGTIATIATPKATFAIVRGGLYRFNVRTDGSSEALVRKGKIVIIEPTAPAGVKTETAQVAKADGQVKVTGALIKGGSKAVIESDTIAIASLDKKAQDGFDTWSKDRAKTLIAANSTLPKRVGRAGVFSNLISSVFFGGIWLYDPFLRCHLFLPGFYGFYSPYGWSYSVWCPPIYYIRPPSGRVNEGGAVVGIGGDFGHRGHSRRGIPEEPGGLPNKHQVNSLDHRGGGDISLGVRIGNPSIERVRGLDEPFERPGRAHERINSAPSAPINSSPAEGGGHRHRERP